MVNRDSEKFVGDLAVVAMTDQASLMTELLPGLIEFFQNTPATIAVISGYTPNISVASNFYRQQIIGASQLGMLRELNPQKNNDAENAAMLEEILRITLKSGVHGLLTIAPSDKARILTMYMHKLQEYRKPTLPGYATAINRKGELFTISNLGLSRITLQGDS